MKKFYLLSILFLCTLGMFAQTPQKMNYQTVIRNSSGMVLANQSVGIQISILQGSALGTAVYVETQTPTTNANGLANIVIGTGSVVSGNFSTINWANNTYFIKTEIDPAGGTSYTITGTSQLVSVPYALYAASSGSAPQVTVIDNLISTSTTKALSANQGKILEGTKLNKTLTNASVFIGDVSNNAVATAISGDATLANNGTLTIANNAVAGTDISLASEAVGDIMYNNGTDWVRLPKGTAGQALTINAGATAPVWVTLPSSSSVPLDNAEYTLPNTVGLTGTGAVNYGSQFTVPAGKHDVLVQCVLNFSGYYFALGTYDIELFDVTNNISIKKIHARYKTTIAGSPSYGGGNPGADYPFARTFTLNTTAATVYKIVVNYNMTTGGNASTSGQASNGNVIVRKVN